MFKVIASIIYMLLFKKISVYCRLPSEYVICECQHKYHQFHFFLSFLFCFVLDFVGIVSVLHFCDVFMLNNYVAAIYPLMVHEIFL